MIGELPVSLEIGGRQYAVRSDFRVVLNIFQAFNDPELTEKDKAKVCLICLYPEYRSIPAKDLKEAVEKAFWFCGGGDMPKSEPTRIKTLDWKHDEALIFPAINKSAGFEVRSCTYMHWWTFLGIFGEIGEGLFSTVMSIRKKISEGKKLEKWEKEFYRKNKELIVLRTEEEQAQIDKTEEFLKTIT